MITTSEIRIDMVWRSWAEQWSREHAVGLRQGNYSRSWLPAGYLNAQGIANLLTAGMKNTFTGQSGLPSKQMMGSPLQGDLLQRVLAVIPSIAKPLPPPMIPREIFHLLKNAPPSPFSVVIEYGGIGFLSTQWAPFKPNIIPPIVDSFPDFELDQPDYDSPDDPILPWPPWDPRKPPIIVNLNKQWERICCAGLDIENREVSAVIQIVMGWGYSLSRCSPDISDSVGVESDGGQRQLQWTKRCIWRCV